MAGFDIDLTTDITDRLTTWADRSHMYRLREFTNNWSPKKYIYIARSLGIDVPDIIPVRGAPAQKLDAVLATRRAKAAAAEAA